MDPDDPFVDAPEDLVDDVALAVESLTLERHGAGSGDLSSLIPDDSDAVPSDAILPSKFGTFDLKSYSPEALKAWRKKSAGELFTDIKSCHAAIDLFMDSKIAAAEAYLAKRVSESLYFGLAMAAIHSLRALITFESDDIQTARSSLKNAQTMADTLRVGGPNIGPAKSMLTNVINSVASVVRPGSHIDVKGMTNLRRHAELIHAEIHLMRAVLSIVTDSNILSFVREGLAIRQSYGTYTAFWSYIEKTSTQKGKPGNVDPRDIGLDNDFVVGVLFGIGVFNLILSMLPPKVSKLFELVGYAANQDIGLACLETACGYPVRQRWSVKTTSSDILRGHPKTCAASTFPLSPRPEGLRQFLGKMLLAVFHTVFPTLVPLANADLSFGQSLLRSESARFPNSIPYGQMEGRIDLVLAQPTVSIAKFRKVMGLQEDWRSLHHLCMWEIILASAASGEFATCAELFGTLLEESKWSKAVYHYGLGVSLYVLGKVEVAGKQMEKVGGAKQKIAGRSIPLEKFLARKARRFGVQGGLVLPELEFFYFFNVLEMMRPEDLRRSRKKVDVELERLRANVPGPVSRSPSGNLATSPTTPTGSSSAATYYDDLALCTFLGAVIDTALESPGSAKRMIQVSHSSVLSKPREPTPAIAASIRTFIETIPGLGDKMSLEHWIVPWARYNAAVALEDCGRYSDSLEQLQLATVGGYSAEEAKAKKWRVGQFTGGGRKFSMEQALQTRGWNFKRRLDLEIAMQKAMVGQMV